MSDEITVGRWESSVQFHACLSSTNGNPEACRVTTTEVACPLCGSEVGQPCVRPSGARMYDFHRVRVDVAYEASIDKAVAFVRAEREAKRKAAQS
jgi:hypothetical protein